MLKKVKLRKTKIICNFKLFPILYDEEMMELRIKKILFYVSTHDFVIFFNFLHKDDEKDDDDDDNDQFFQYTSINFRVKNEK